VFRRPEVSLGLAIEFRRECFKRRIRRNIFMYSSVMKDFHVGSGSQRASA